MSGAANFKILVSRPSRSRVLHCFKCFRALCTSVTVNRGISSVYIWIFCDWQNWWRLTNVLLLMEFLVVIFPATVAKWSFTCSTDKLKSTCWFGKDTLFVSWCIAQFVDFKLFLSDRRSWVYSFFAARFWELMAFLSLFNSSSWPRFFRKSQR